MKRSDHFIGAISLGCVKNRVDTELMLGQLVKAGYNLTPDPEEADVILINTCAVRQGAEEKVLVEVGALKRLKKENPDLVIGIGGCMAQEEETVRAKILPIP